MGKDKPADEKPAENGKEEAEEKPAENGKEEADEKPAENGKKEDEKPAENGDVKKDEKKKNSKEVEAEEDEGESSGEEELGMLDKPVEILSRKRERKSTEFFVDKKEQPKEEIIVDYAEGKGTKFGDIAFINWEITHADTEDLDVLHRLLYRKKGNPHMVKKNIRQFCGYPFDKTHKYYKTAEALAYRLIIPGLRYINGVLGLEISQDKEKMRTDLLEFLMEPKDLGKEVPTKSAPAKSKKKKKSKTPKRKSQPRKSKEAKSDGSGSDVSEASDESGEEEEEEEKPAKSPKKKPTPKKKATKATPVKISLPTKKKSASKKRKPEPESDASSEDEPLNKKKKGPPTDSELKKLVGSILKDADLEQVTMKNVVKQVYDKYSSFDLTSRKDYIKTCVKELIS